MENPLFLETPIYPNNLAEFCPSNILLKLLLDDVGCIPQKKKVTLKKKRPFLFVVFLFFFAANLHIKLTHHANEDIQYKDLGKAADLDPSSEVKSCQMGKQNGTLPETNIFAPRNGWLEYDPLLLGFDQFSGANC